MPKTHLALSGLIAAVHTPFGKDGELAPDTVPQQAAHLAATGVTGVFVAGTTGECSTLAIEERERLLEAWVECAGPLTVIAHVGHDAPRLARRLATHAQRTGAAAIGALPPTYLKPRGIPELVETCSFIASGAPDLPFYYYDIPMLSGVKVATADFLDQARDAIANWGGVKYTNPDHTEMQECIRRGHTTLYGCDETMLAGLALGTRGAVGSTYNFAGPLYQRLIAAWERGDLETARAEQHRSVQLVRTLQTYDYMGAAKSVMGMLGIDCGPVRLPLYRQSDAELSQLREDLEELGFFDWVRPSSSPRI